ncbi:MAG TPA: thiamine-phosphate kinase [Leptolyngbyaceae cyanobacterium M65_K2018_010]|nr:thiamine-phosphate kinase [Leptolyngbyaceae cyanobacterium M65_K2018_010]
MADPQTVGQVGELGLLKRLFQYCADGMVGDDAAVLEVPPHQRLVVTTDVLVDGVHFSDRTTAAGDVGWRAVAANLSDLAAMGAIPLGITVGLSLPGTTALAWVEQLYDGMAACLKIWGGAVIGGDLCRSETISVAITALGSAAPDQLLYRHTAQPGQLILATGYHGLSRAGLELLLQPEQGQALDPADRDRWIRAHCRPNPRLDAIALLRSLLRDINLDAVSIAAMDSSDGLANAVLHLCQASGCGARLWPSHLPLDPALVAWVGPAQALDWCLYGGEDFELLLCLPAAIAQSLELQLGQGSAIIGQVTQASSVILEPDPAWSTSGLELTFTGGFQHF